MNVLFPPSLQETEGLTECELNGVPIHWTYIQPEDCCGGVKKGEQSIEFKIQDGGGGAYLVLKTERFAFSFEEFMHLAKELKKLGKEYDKRNKI